MDFIDNFRFPRNLITYQFSVCMQIFINSFQQGEKNRNKKYDRINKLSIFEN